MKTTQLPIRIQANGGMFLGPDSFGGAIITIEDISAGVILAEGMTDNGDSGTRTSEPAANTSPFPIITPTTPTATVYWPVVASTTVQYLGEISLSGPTLVKITVEVPLPPSQGNQCFSLTQWISPEGQNYPEAGFVIPVSGLWVQPELATMGNILSIKAKVTMMCGCEINNNSPWIPTDFEVFATIQAEKGGTSPVPNPIQLSFDVNSQFTIIPIDLPSGRYEVQISAFQKSTGNSGVGMQMIEIG